MSSTWKYIQRVSSGPGIQVFAGLVGADADEIYIFESREGSGSAFMP